MVTVPRTSGKTLTILGLTAPIATWKSAYERACSQGIRVFHRGNQWLTDSISEPGRLHHVIGGHCDCKAGQAGRLCKHVAAVRSAQLVAGELVRCPHCHYVGTSAEVTTRLGYVGGKGYLPFVQCVDEVLCWSRWDQQHGLAR